MELDSVCFRHLFLLAILGSNVHNLWMKLNEKFSALFLFFFLVHKMAYYVLSLYEYRSKRSLMFHLDWKKYLLLHIHWVGWLRDILLGSFMSHLIVRTVKFVRRMRILRKEQFMVWSLWISSQLQHLILDREEVGRWRTLPNSESIKFVQTL